MEENYVPTDIEGVYEGPEGVAIDEIAFMSGLILELLNRVERLETSVTALQQG
jgi:hypothetical protein